eukprot:Filipodium_phascolosomae@DN833_c0_g2_i1.p1
MGPARPETAVSVFTLLNRHELARIALRIGYFLEVLECGVRGGAFVSEQRPGLALVGASHEKVSGKFSAVWLDSEKFGSHAESNLGLKEFPGLVLQMKEGRYVHTDKISSASDVHSFVENAMGGKLEKSIRSEEVPENNDEAVKVVVGKNFEEMVMKSDKDVLLEVYAPWCGHCKKLEPIYKELAESVSGNTHILISKMDGTQNEIPFPDFEWTGFPTLFFKKAGEAKPKQYDGERTLQALLEFVRKESSQPNFEPANARDEL